ncbi:hypothetical protein [Pontiella sulfatireligans]|uniref:Uncharacterized protein n=1 Tax=Pontiella sulfatireligans TaxID=2750658 RepID=A0A6C2ULK5_9BACT|nr:hypothetical protein [Pontiella sulfatireligans]VGO21130.1 hypothetical protein SCARR_03200 [Pontiella sulfatireligans]
MNWKPNLIQRVLMMVGATACFVGVYFAYQKHEAWNALSKATVYKHPYGVYAVLIIFGILLTLLAFHRCGRIKTIEVKVIHFKPRRIFIALFILSVLGLLWFSYKTYDLTDRRDALCRHVAILEEEVAQLQGKAAEAESCNYDLTDRGDALCRHVAILEEEVAQLQGKAAEAESCNAEADKWYIASQMLIYKIGNAKSVNDFKDLHFAYTGYYDRSVDVLTSRGLITKENK